MTTGSELFGWGDPGARGGGQGATGAPDFVRSDRGDSDDHWSRAVGQECGKCGVKLATEDFARRRHDGTWVHESCPSGSSSEDGLAKADESAGDTES